MPSWTLQERDQFLFVLLVCYFFDMIDTQDVLMYLLATRQFRIKRPREENRFRDYDPLNIDDWTEFEVETAFCFKRDHIYRIFPFFQFPEFFESEGGQKSSGFEAFLIVLYRLSNTQKWSDIVRVFGPHKRSHLSSVFNQAIRHLVLTKQHLLHTLPAYYRDPARLRRFATAVYQKSGHIPHCVCFIDGHRPTRFFSKKKA